MKQLLLHVALPHILGSLLLYLCCGSAFCNSMVSNFSRQHQLAVRFGGWQNTGTLPPVSLQIGSTLLRTDMGSGSFYLEGDYSHRVSPIFGLGFSVGVVSRGDVTFVDGFGDSFYGSLVIYPILARAKLYPFAASNLRFQPYVALGGGLYYGRHDVQISTSPISFSALQEQSRSKFSYAISGGIDYPLASVVGLELSACYMPVKFSEKLVENNDYSGIAILFGVKYLMSPKKQLK